MAIGMAMSGTVQNFAGGIMILVFKPFRSGDYIEAQGYAGTVSDIDIFSTKLVTTDNKVIMIPNGALSNGTINNYSKQQYRRVEWVVGVEYGTDFEYAKSVISEIISGDTRIQSEPQLPFIGIAALSASSVDITIRAWVLKEDYWDVFYDYNAKFYKILPQKGINFPFPQMDAWSLQERPTARTPGQKSGCTETFDAATFIIVIQQLVTPAVDPPVKALPASPRNLTSVKAVGVPFVCAS